MPRPLPSAGPLILDGALATELESRGLTLSSKLWSAAALRAAPAAIRAVHAGYFSAGAHVATTASYQASVPGLLAAGYSHGEAAALLALSVQLAREARDAAAHADQLLVAGSVGPYGAFLADGSEYTGAYALDAAAFRDFHRGRIAALLGAGADVLALETLPHAGEVAALAALLADEFPAARAWVALSVRRGGEGEEEGVVLADGTPLLAVARVLDAAPQVVAVGVNCVPPGVVAAALRALRRGTPKPLLAYPNSGEVWDAQAKCWHGAGAEEQALEGRVREWWAAGARWIGGCCRVGPAGIAVIQRTVEALVREEEDGV